MSLAQDDGTEAVATPLLVIQSERSAREGAEGVEGPPHPLHRRPGARDPGESRNLAGQDGVERSWLRAHARRWSQEVRSEDGAPAPGVDEDTREQLRALGYVE